MPKTYRVTDIHWDTDGEEVDLIAEATVTVPDDEYEDEDEYVQQYLSDWLSDTTGFCHYGFEYEPA